MEKSCPLKMMEYHTDTRCVEDRCAFWYEESPTEKGCAIERIAYYLNWIGSLLRHGRDI